jgi:hypothetical protein
MAAAGGQPKRGVALLVANIHPGSTGQQQLNKPTGSQSLVKTIGLVYATSDRLSTVLLCYWFIALNIPMCIQKNY